MMNMKVLLMGDYPDKSGQVVGGVQGAATVLSKELAKTAGIELTVVSCQAGISVPEVVHRDGVEVHYLPCSTRAGLFTQHLANRLRLRRKIAQQLAPDIIHVQNTGFHALAALESGLPTVITVHGIFLEDGKFLFRRGAGGRIRRALFDRIHNRCLKQVEHVITVSPYAQAVVNHLSCATTYAVNNPVDPIFFEQRWAPRNGRLSFVGVIVPLKGIEYLLRAMVRLRVAHPHLRLDLIGKVVDADYYDSLRQYIEEQRLAARVRFLGQMDKSAIARQYAISSVVVLPSLQENAPIVLSEAMAVGCPAVATRVGGVPTMLEDSVTGILVEPRSPEALASAISKLVGDRRLCQAMSMRARKRAVENFSPCVVAAKTVEVYRRVLSLPDDGVQSA